MNAYTSKTEYIGYLLLVITVTFSQDMSQETLIIAISHNKIP